MKETSATDEPMKFGCEFCKRVFLRESTIMKHMCETKDRYLNKDKQGNRIGFQAWVQFYKKNTATKKQKTYEEFIKSAYYIAFVKFGNYCVNVSAINISRFVDWLLKNQIKIDTWCSDTTYTRYLVEYLKIEDAFDAIHRSVETTIDWAEKDNIQPRDYLRYGNTNRICLLIATGKISPWMLYCSESGIQFLDKLNEAQVKIVIDYINPELWKIKFNRDEQLKQQITDTLKIAGY
jgi:hypothetical protein